MQLKDIQKIHDGKYLKQYELSYINKAGREKKYEIVSRKEISGPEDLGRRVSGVSIIAYKDNKMLLLHEFRMALNKEIYNLCAGMIEEGETIEECVRRELYEETGLRVKRFIDVLPPSYSAVGISDISTQIVFVEADGEFSYHTSDNEQIKAAFYSKEEIEQLLLTEEFSARSQIAAYFFLKNH
nr:NUDIX hydrolase [Lachnospiraceae bacterium]